MEVDPLELDDERTLVDHEQARKNARDQELEDIRSLVKVPFGVRFLKRLFSEGKILQTTFTGNSQGFFLEGQRNLALKFLADVCEAAPNSVAKVILEKKE